MPFLKNLSIKNKLIFAFLLVTLLPLCAGFTIVFLNELASFKTDITDETIVMARIIGDSSVRDLASRDRAASERILTRLIALPGVECGFLYDSNGSLFSSYRKPDCTANSSLGHRTPVLFKNGSLDIIQPVISQHQNYGTIRLVTSSKPFYNRIKKSLITAFWLTALLSGLTVLLASQFQKLISKPILDLAEATKRVSSDRNYLIRVEKTTNDEIGMLSERFNKMVGQIQVRKEERDRAEQALRESENRYRLLVESSPEGIFLEQDGQVIYANPAALKLCGYKSQAGILGTLSQLFSRDLEKPRGNINEAKLKRSDGSVRDTEVTWIQTSYAGKPALQGLFKDITESKQLRETAQKMERLAALGEFSAILAHEIRNALGSVTLNLRFLTDHVKVPNEYAKHLTNIELGVHRIQDTIKQVLGYSRPMPPAFRRVDIHKVLDSSLRFVENELEQAGIDVIREFDPACSELPIDPDQIGQVFGNLFLNALHAMQPGGKLVIRTKREPDEIEVQVADTGKGIPPENLDKIFNPFFTTSPQGVGLGLAFVTRILEQHKAHVSVKSDVGEGTVFSIRFRVSPNEK